MQEARHTLDVEEVEAALRARRLALTPQRRAILRCLAGRRDHPTARQVYEDVTRQFPITSRATVYNTLALLLELGFVDAVAAPGGELRYDPNTRPHHHLVCRACGALEDVPFDQARVEIAPGAVRLADARASIRFEGICKACAG